MYPRHQYMQLTKLDNKTQVYFNLKSYMKICYILVNQFQFESGFKFFVQ